MSPLPPAALHAASAGDPALAALLAPGGPVAAALDALAVELTGRGWVADLRHPVGGPNGLFVRNPDPGAAMLSEHVLVAPGPDGTLAYWWPWADQIAPAADVHGAADVVTRVLRCADADTRR